VVAEAGGLSVITCLPLSAGQPGARTALPRLAVIGLAEIGKSFSCRSQLTGVRRRHVSRYAYFL